MKFDMFDFGLKLIATVAICLLLIPIILVCLSSFTAGTYITFPPRGFTLIHYFTVLTESRWVSAFKNSMIIAVCVTCVSIFISTPAALVVSKYKFKRQAITISFLVLMPLLFPGVLIGISLLMTLSVVRLQGTYIAFVIGHSLEAVALSFMVMRAAMTRLDPTLTEAALNLGANRIQAFFEVTLPLLKPAILSCVLLSFISSLHEFVISYFVMSQRIFTLPIVIWTSLKYMISPEVGAVSCLLIFSVAVTLLAVSKLVGIEKIGF